MHLRFWVFWAGMLLAFVENVAALEII